MGQESDHDLLLVISEKVSCLPDLQKSVQELKEDFASYKTKTDTNSNEIEKLRSENRTWNGINSIGTIIAGILGIFIVKP